MQEKKLDVVEMGMLRWRCGDVTLDKSKVGHVTKVEDISKKVHASRFKWYRYVMRIEEVYVDKRVMLMEGRETKEDRSGGGRTVSSTT